MTFTQIWANANVLGDYLLGGTSEKRTVSLTADNVKIVLPVTPRKYNVETEQMNKIVDILDFGEALIFGNAKLKKIKFGIFLPATVHNYPFVVGVRKEPNEIIDQITKWKESKKPVRLIITDSPINLMTAIMSFDYDERDGSRDIYYNISLTEYKNLNTPPANNQQQVDENTGLKERPLTEQSQSQKQSFVDKARDVLEKSKKAYGTFQKIQQFKDKNALQHLALKNIRSQINGNSWTW